MAEELKDYWSDPEPEDPKTTKTVKYVAKSPVDDRIKARIEEYMADLDKSSITVSDRSQIKNLARIEIALEEMSEKLTSIGTMSDKDRKSLSSAYNEFSTQARMISSALGIDRKSRANRGEGEYESYLPRLHQEAQAFLAEHSLMIVCPHCIQDKAHTKIVEGTIIFHFRDDVEWSWNSHCPKCKQPFTIDYTNWQEFTRANIERLGRGNATEEDSIE